MQHEGLRLVEICNYKNMQKNDWYVDFAPAHNVLIWWIQGIWELILDVLGSFWEINVFLFRNTQKAFHFPFFFIQTFLCTFHYLYYSD